MGNRQINPKMLKTITLVAAIATGTLSVASAHETHSAANLNKPEINDLMTRALEAADGLEVIMSRVAMPPNFTLPKHWHPGEEFAYLLEGSLTLLLEGQSDVEFSQGDSGVVPLKHIHTARSGPNGATILVFRVHEKGQPGRVLVKK